MALLSIDAIDRKQFDAVLSRYADIAPSKLADLDQQRYSDLPKLVEERAADEGAYITKDELVKLVEWKVSHGKFRPTLRKLALENEEDVVKDVTARAFEVDSTQALKLISSLRGVGPATASLLLSVYSPEKMPFFSDELFRWCLWQGKTGSGWDRKIKYNVKEYSELQVKVSTLQERLKVSAIDCEKVAYVLGKTEVNLDIPMAQAESTDAASTDTVKKSRKRGHDEEPVSKRSTRKKSS